MRAILLTEALDLIEEVMTDHELSKDDQIIKLMRACTLYECLVLYLSEEIENIKPLWTVHDG